MPSTNRDAILTRSQITTGYRLSYLANFFVGPLYSKIARRTGLARSEFVVIFCLHHLGVLMAQEICDITGRPKNSISQAVTKLVRLGLIEKQVDNADGRRAPLKITLAGTALYTGIIPMFQQREQAMLSVLTEREREQFERLLGKLVLRSDNWEQSN